jgi:hypothetical protein
VLPVGEMKPLGDAYPPVYMDEIILRHKSLENKKKMDFGALWYAVNYNRAKKMESLWFGVSTLSIGLAFFLLNGCYTLIFKCIYYLSKCGSIFMTLKTAGTLPPILEPEAIGIK